MGRVVKHCWHAVCAFRGACRGATAIEVALSVSVLVIVFAGLMEIVHSAYVSDSMDRAARAAARAVALVPDAEGDPGTLGSVACAAIRRELDLAEDFDCGASWTLSVDTDLTPAAMLEGEGSDDDEADGGMVVVRIAWNREPWEIGRLLEETVEGDSEPTRYIAVGVALQEPGTGT